MILEWQQYCDYLSKKADKTKKPLLEATDSGFIEWKVEILNLKIEKLNIELADKHINFLCESIVNIEKSLDEEEFKDYCDSINTAIAYWQLVKNKNSPTKNDDILG